MSKPTKADIKIQQQLVAEQRKLADMVGSMSDTYQLQKSYVKEILNASDQTLANYTAEKKVLDQIKKLKEADAKVSEKLSETSQQILAASESQIKALKQQNKLIQNTKKGFAVVNDAAKDLVGKADAFIKKFPGGAYLSKLMGLDKLADQFENGINAAAEAFLTSMLQGKGLTASLGAGMKAFNAIVKMNPMALIAAAAIGLVAAFKSISKEAQKVSADTGLTYTQSKLLVKEANKQVAAFGNQLSTQSDIIAVQKEQIAQLGVIGKLSGEQAGAVSDIGKAFGYGAAQAGKVNAAFMAMGVSADNAANAQRDLAAEALKSGVNVATVTKDIADNAGTTAKFFGGNVKALKAAAIEAAKMGVSLATMAKVSESLLDFESSISSQFELQALTGKQMNFDLARQAALEGDIAKATSLVMDQVGSIHDFNKMDVLERKKLAQATGMDVDELQKSLTIKSKMGDLTSDELASMNALGLSAAEMENMSAKDLQNKLAQQQSSEKTAAAFAAMKAQLVNALMPAGQALMSVFAALSPLLKVIGVGLKIAFMPITLAGKAMGALIGFMEKFKGITAGVLVLTGLIVAKKKEEAMLNAIEIGKASALNALKVVRVALENASLGAIIKQGAATAVNLAKTAFEGALVLGKAIAGLFSSFSAIPFGIGIPLAIAAAGGLFSMFNKATAVGDLGIDPNGGPIVSSPTVGGIFQGDKRDGLSMGPGMGTSPSAGGAGVVNNYYGEKDNKGVTMQQVIDAISNISINMDGKELSATIRTADSFRRG